MIRFRQIHDPEREPDRSLMDQARLLFRHAFPHEPEAIERIARWMRRRPGMAFEPILLVAQDMRGQVIGLSFVFHFRELRIGYLQYIASDPARPGRGIGGALYEATREILQAREGRGLVFDVPPVDADKLGDDAKEMLDKNRKRLRFYERYGARIIDGTQWDREPNPRNAYYLTQLMFDPLGGGPRLRRADARETVRRILTTQYGFKADDPFVARIVASFKDDPVRLRPITRAVKPAAVVVAPSDGKSASSSAKASSRLKAIPTNKRRILPIKLVVADGHQIHHLKERGYVERPVRVDQILKGIEGLPIERVAVKHFPDQWVTEVHDKKLVSYMKAVCAKLTPQQIVYPEVFPIRRADRAPSALEDRAGYFCADTFTPLTRHAYPTARRAVDTALTAAQLVRDGERFAYALCRPPGHHAERRIYGGFCFLNNSAIAANMLAKDGKVALLDIDYHHGNGAQDIFYERADVLTLSIHGHPRHAYPNFSGYADEIGAGAGVGFNRNWPLEPPVDDARYISILEQALKAVRKFEPRHLVVSLGFDIMHGDPTGAFALTTKGLAQIADAIGAMRLPTLFVQEGGYAIRNLRIGARAFFEAVANSWYA